MDLWAYYLMSCPEVDAYIKDLLWEIPRPRWIRFMKIEKLIPDADQYWIPHKDFLLFNKYVWKDVIYVHTRCGWREDNPLSNYMSCWWKEFEERNRKRFLWAQNETFDPTYRDHYFEAKKNKAYKEILKKILNP